MMKRLSRSSIHRVGGTLGTLEVDIAAILGGRRLGGGGELRGGWVFASNDDCGFGIVGGRGRHRGTANVLLCTS